MRASAHIRALVVAAVAATLAAPAGAEVTTDSGRLPIAVRATETEQGSRLEIPIADTPYAITRTAPRRLDVTLTGVGRPFDVSQLSLGRLARQVASARSGRVENGAELTLILTCECAYDARLEEGVLTIDIVTDPKATDPEPATAETPVATPEEKEPEAHAAKDASHNETHEAKTVAPAVAPKPTAAPERKPVEAPEPKKTAAIEPWPGTKNAPQRAPAPPSRGEALHTAAGEAAEADPATDYAEAAGDEVEDVLLARQRLLEQLTRAADQGLLEFDGAHTPQPGGVLPSPRAKDAATETAAKDDEGKDDGASTDAASTSAEEPAVAEAPAAAAPPRELAVRARTASDRDFAPRRADTYAAPAECPEPALLALPAPVEDGAAFSARTATLRAEVVDEFGAPVPDAVTRLARHYIAQRFGVEAEHTLTLLDGVDGSIEPRERLRIRKERALLEDMARVVERDLPRADSVLAATAACGGLIGLWAEASGVVRGDWARDPAHTENLTNTFDDAPAWIRVSLGPRLIESRVSLGDLETAQRLTDILRRTPGSAGGETDMALARLYAARGDHAGATALLRTLTDIKSPEAGDALLAMAAAYGPDAPPPPGFAARLSEAAWLADGGALAGPLKLAEIRMVALADGPVAALDSIRNAITRGGVDTAVLTDAGHGVLETLKPAGNDGAERLQLARAIETYAPFISTGRDGDRARAAAADALTDMGLVTMALEMLAPVDEARTKAVTEAAARARKIAGEGEPETPGGEPEAGADERDEAETPVAEAAEPLDPKAAALAAAEEALAAARAARSKLEEMLGDG